MVLLNFVPTSSIFKICITLITNCVALNQSMKRNSKCFLKSNQSFSMPTLFIVLHNNGILYSTWNQISKIIQWLKAFGSSKNKKQLTFQWPNWMVSISYFSSRINKILQRWWLTTTRMPKNKQITSPQSKILLAYSPRQFSGYSFHSNNLAHYCTYVKTI